MATLRTKVISIFFAEEQEYDANKVPVNVDVGEENDDDDLPEIAAAVSSCLNQRQHGVRIPGYFETVVPRYSGKNFKSHFRLYRCSIENLAQLLKNNINFQQKNKGGKPMIDLTKQICVFLWYASSREPLRTIADRFDITESSVHTTIRRVVNGVIEEMISDLIKWPSGKRHCWEIVTISPI